MTRSCTRWAVVVLAVAVAGLSVPHAETIEAVLVKVNGDIITKTDLETRQVAALRQRGGTQHMSDAELKKVIAEVTPEIIVDTVDELLLLQRGRELGYHLTDDRFNQILDNIKKENKLDTPEQFDAALKAENMTLPELRRSIEKQVVINQVQQNEVVGHISVTEDEARDYYDAHKSEFSTPSSMMVREILIAVPRDLKGINVGKDEAAKARADALREQLVNGESFEHAVAESSDASSKANGGLIGPISKEELDPSLRTQFEPLKAGDLTPVIRTSAGYQIYKVESLTEAKVQPYDQAREQIGDHVANTKRMAEFVKYLQKLRAQAVIDWKNPELKKLFEDKVADEVAEAARQNVTPAK
jgi:peptidyl-prolyl cis-trans isomerase SurA